MSANLDAYNMDERFDDRWRSDIVESYFDDKYVPLQRRDSNLSNQPLQQNMLTAPPLEKTDSSWSPMSSGLVTPQDSIGFWTVSPDRRRSGRFSVDSVGCFGQSNRWSLGTQLSNVSLTEMPTQVNECDEEKEMQDKLQDWNTIDSSGTLSDDDDKIFHPDDEIILDPKESSEAPIARASIGTRPPEWPTTDTISKRWTSIDDGLRGSRAVQPTALNLSVPSKDRQSLRISTSDPFETGSESTRTSYSFCSDATPFKYPQQYDLPKVTNRRSFVDSPPEIFNSDAWPLTGSTPASSHSTLWSPEKSLPPTPRSRGVSISTSRRDEYPRGRMSGTCDTIRSAAAQQHTHERPASWNPRYDVGNDFALNLDRAILGTSLARDHRMHLRNEENMEEQDPSTIESIFNTLKLSETPSNRSSTTNGSVFRDSRNFTWPHEDGYRERSAAVSQSTAKEPPHTPLTEAQRHRNVMNRILYERNLNPAHFDASPKHARYFVIKSYNEDDVHKSLKFNIWASTEIGNRRLDKAYRESSRTGPIYLFFSVNASGQFCGMARMMSPVDYTTSSSVWTQTDKWKGRMDVRWIFVKDIPNSQLRHIRVWNNENKPVTNSRDTQELPSDAGIAMLRIFSDYPSKSSVILTNLVLAEMKAEVSKAENRHTTLHAADEFSYRNSTQPSDDYRQIGDRQQRQSWQSIDEQKRSRQTSHSDLYNNIESRIPMSAASLNRRNTIASTPAATMGRLASSATPTSGMRMYEKSHPAPPRYQENPSTYRSMLSGFASLGEVYGSHRYPPFHDRGQIDEGRYF